MTFNISSLLKPEVFVHPVKTIELIETHISWVILTGDFAYKIKKPVDFGFLDFSTLEKRYQFCRQELRLNSRLAPAIYLDVVAICGTENKPVISSNGKAFEYAVKMAQFPQSAQLDHMLAEGKLETRHIDAIAIMVADFHQTTEVSDDTMAYGDNDMVYQPVEENFRQIKQHLNTDIYADKLDAVARWCNTEFIKLEAVFEQRKHDGFIRECHGDMHLRNLVWLDEQAMAFDCIEFNPDLRWIDVMSEVAFLVMDLQNRKQQTLANHFLNAYVELTGDYSGLTVLPFYLCYRALVRAKVDALRLTQSSLSAKEKDEISDEFESYVNLAASYTRGTAAKLIIMRGLSASGKSSVSQNLLDKTAAIRIRSDVERKRLFSITSTDSTSDKIDSGIYSEDASQQTYTRLLELTAMVIKTGRSVIVDAAFLKREQREPFEKFARQSNIPFIILELSAPASILRQRISQRKNDASDANLAVLKHQLANWQPLLEEEMKTAITVNTAETLDAALLAKKIENYSSTYTDMKS